jgi:predicted lipoprotein with Yx(FWY)xxD motif
MKIKTILMSTLLVMFVAVSAWGMHHAVKISEKEGVGKYLADSEGKTLYWFKKDSMGMSACSGPCVEKWPLFYRETVAPAEGLSVADFATISREDGAMQTTFRGYPLYYWQGDAAAGDTSGQGKNDVWYVVDPDNFPAQ